MVNVTIASMVNSIALGTSSILQAAGINLTGRRKSKASIRSYFNFPRSRKTTTAARLKRQATKRRNIAKRGQK